MLHDEVPLRVVHPVVKVCDGDLDSPVGLVVELNMPVDPGRAHVACALDYGPSVAQFSWARNCRSRVRRVTTAGYAPRVTNSKNTLNRGAGKGRAEKKTTHSKQP